MLLKFIIGASYHLKGGQYGVSGGSQFSRDLKDKKEEGCWKGGVPDRGNNVYGDMEMRLKLVYSGHRKKFSIVGT